MPFIEEYKNKKFLGNNITHGQDRFMTNIFLREGYKSINIPGAVGYTYPKNDYKTLLKQYLRWRKSSIRESFRCAKYCRSNNTYLSVWSIFHIILPFSFLLIWITILLSDILTFNPIHPIIIFGSILTIISINELPLFVKYPKLIPLVPIACLFNLILVMPLWILALFSLDNNSWGTR